MPTDGTTGSEDLVTGTEQLLGAGDRLKEGIMPPNLSPFIPNPYKVLDDDYAKALQKATLAATSFSAALYAAPYAPSTVAFITKYAFGFQITAGRGIVVKPNVVINLLPQPIGVVNPSVYMLPRGMGDLGMLKRAVTSRQGLQAYLDQFPEQQDRNDAMMLETQRRRLQLLTNDQLETEKRALEPTFLSGQYGRDLAAVFRQEEIARATDVRIAQFQPPPPVVVQPAGFDPFSQQALVNALAGAPPEERAVIIANARQIPGIVIPVSGGSGVAAGSTPVPARASPLDPFGRPIAMGSLQPSTIKPINAKALANERAAKGIQRELVHERADP